MSPSIAVLTLVGFTAAVALFAVAAQGGDVSAHAATVNVDLHEWSVTPDVGSVEAVTFEAANTGSGEHELIVIRTDLAPAALPLTTDGAEVDVSALDVIGEIEEVAPGLTQSATFTLAPGDYVLICNVPFHYEAGMTVAFTVSAPVEEAAPEVEAGPEDSPPAALPAAGGGASAALLAALLAAIAAAGFVALAATARLARRPLLARLTPRRSGRDRPETGR